MSDVQDVTLGEIVRSLTDLREEIRALRAEHVRRDLYEAHRATFVAELARVERKVDTENESRTTGRRAATVAILGAGLSLLVQLIVILVG
jgi:hypothetical protein